MVNNFHMQLNASQAFNTMVRIKYHIDNSPVINSFSTNAAFHKETNHLIYSVN